MADGTHIEWTEATANVINGCSLESPGCTNCYAMRLAGTRLRNHPTCAGLTQQTKAGPVWTGEVRFHEPALLQVLRWQRPRMIFWNAHGDMFHPGVPYAWIDRCFAGMALTPQHIHQVLTKRSARMREYFAMTSPTRLWSVVREIAGNTPEADAANDSLGAGWPLRNVWLGVSVEDQQRADERIPDLLATPAAVRWLSCEPLLGPVGLDTIYLRRDGQRPTELSNCLGDYVRPLVGNFTDSPRINWIVAGGESGPGARPMHPDWARSLRDQCASAGVAFHFKQHGEWAASGPHNRETVIGGPEGASHPRFETRWIENAPRPGRMLVARVGKKRAGRLLDGVEHNGMPGQ